MAIAQYSSQKKSPRQKARRFFGAPAGISPIGDELRLPGSSRKKIPPPKGEGIFFGAPAGIRTPDTLLKRQVLYLLSYWGRWLGWRDSNPLYRSQSPVCYHYTTSQCTGTELLQKGRTCPTFLRWGGIWGSNPRHPEPQSGALPTELIPPNDILYKTPCGDCTLWHAKRDSNPRPTA